MRKSLLFITIIVIILACKSEYKNKKFPGTETEIGTNSETESKTNTDTNTDTNTTTDTYSEIHVTSQEIHQPGTKKVWKLCPEYGDFMKGSCYESEGFYKLYNSNTPPTCWSGDHYRVATIDDWTKLLDNCNWQDDYHIKCNSCINSTTCASMMYDESVQERLHLESSEKVFLTVEQDYVFSEDDKIAGYISFTNNETLFTYQEEFPFKIGLCLREEE